jgi:sugar phosphate isomerase/epimerase
MERIAERCEAAGIYISALGIFANSLKNNELKTLAKKDWNTLVDFAQRFQIPVISGFTGRVPGKPVEVSFKPIEDFFTPVANRCLNSGIKLAFENCPMEGNKVDGDWNIAFLPELWEILFNHIFPTDAVGLEFDPAHCVRLKLPVLDLLNDWLPRIHHIHGKDASNQPPQEFRFPGEGSVDWLKIMKLIQTSGYAGTIDLEGYHGEFISHEYEMDNQRKSLNYLKECRLSSARGHSIN